MRDYLSRNRPNPPGNRFPWYRIAAPLYASLFLWVGYYQQLAAGTVDRAELGLLFFGLLIGGALSFLLFFLIPATMGMQTGYPTAVLGSSTFGSKGGRVAPGIVVALVQSVWVGAAAYYAARLFTALAGLDSSPRSPLFLAVAVVWSCAFAFAGSRSLRSLTWLAPLAALAFFALLYAVFSAKEGLELYGLDLPEAYPATMLVIQLVTGFFASTAAVSPAISRYSPSSRDLRSAGVFGIVLPAVLAGSLALVTVAGARGLHSGEGFGLIAAALGVAGSGAPLMAGLLLAGAVPATAFLAWMANDSFIVMSPSRSRPLAIVPVAGIASLVAVSGAPGHLQAFVTLTAALTAPICGIMAADYWQHDRRWPHSRPGVNYAGFGAWAIGLLVGVAPLLPIPEHFLKVANPAAVFACLAGFIGYIVLGNMGLKPYRKHRRKRIRLDSWDDETPEAAAARARRATHHRPSSAAGKSGSSAFTAEPEAGAPPSGSEPDEPDAAPRR